MSASCFQFAARWQWRAELGLFWPLLFKPALGFALLLSLALSPALAQTEPYISELMAANTGPLADEDGEYSDWIEIHNPTTNVVSLNGWYLTDSAASLTKWRFPAVTLPPNGYLIVFASNKDRRSPDTPLHTNFRLADGGEYLGLVKPDGTNVVHAYAPRFPVQVPRVSYGVPVVQTDLKPLAAGARGRFLVPSSSALETNWFEPGFNDAAWMAVTNGVGFDYKDPALDTPVLVADSVAGFSGTQGRSNWFYGYWDKLADTDGSYDPTNDFRPFPNAGGPWSATNFWNGTLWNWFAGDPPWTELNATGGHPSGGGADVAIPVHWAIRRFICPSNGTYRIYGILYHGGTCGDGTLARILVNGAVVLERPVLSVSVGYSVRLEAVAGARIDFVIDPGAAASDSCDGTTFTGRIMTAPPALSRVADSLEDWSDSGVQGWRNWTYGYAIRPSASSPTNGYQTTNFVAFPRGSGPHSANDYWTGAAWDWYGGNPPWDFLSREQQHPNGASSSGGFHWVIRRWVSPVAASLVVDWHLAKADPAGNGVTGRILVNGVERDRAVIAGTDAVGVARSLWLTNIREGDVLDFVLDATGPSGDTGDAADWSWFNLVIHGVPKFSSSIASDVGAAMRGVNASAYLRLPMVVTNPAAVAFLKLRLKYDDGFAAYLNGIGVAALNIPPIPEPLRWDSPASAQHADIEALRFEEFDLSLSVGLLRPGTNVLAIQGLNQSAADPDFLLLPEVVTSTLRTETNAQRYFSTPTPGGPNGLGNTNLGPLIVDLTHEPDMPRDVDDLYVIARLVTTFRPVNPASVRLYYRVMYNAESSTPMYDDGLHADGFAGDGLYGGVVPASAATAGQMIRFYVIAADDQGRQTRFPFYDSPLDSPQYDGTVVANPVLTNPLPVLHWFIQNPSAAESQTGTRCAFFFNGEFYDNVEINLHGQSSSGFPKKSYDVDFNTGYGFRYDPRERRAGDINLMTTYPDKSHIRNILSYETYRNAGVGYHWVFSVRVQQNSLFWGDAHLMENGDAEWLDRLGLDPNGALYKMYNRFNNLNDTIIGINGNFAEKKTRKYEGSADLVALLNGVQQSGEARRRYLYDHLDVPQMINSIAARVITGDHDCCHKNYYLYRDTVGTGDWQFLPWDVDLAWGRRWITSMTYWDDTVVSDSAITLVLSTSDNSILGALNSTPEIVQMYWRRLRTLMDQILQEPGQFILDYRLERRMDQLAAPIVPDAALDLAKWGTWGNGSASSTCCIQTLLQNVEIMKNIYLPARRRYLFITNSVSAGRNIPLAQPSNAVPLITHIEANPSSQNQAEEYIRLLNSNNIALDISGWSLTGAVQFTFRGGTVIPARSNLFVTPDIRAFRARASSPRGGQALLVQGDYKGQLSARGETVWLIDRAGTVRQSTNYPGSASLPQQYLRITEIMYHPEAPASPSAYLQDDFEYLELKNIGPVALSLIGVHFTNGVSFTFTGSAVTNLAAGASVVVVKNAAAFAARYGSGPLVAGEYAGYLENGGEAIRLDDAVGEKILDFEYSDSWYPVTDGLGFSLVIVDATAPWNTWGLKASWRPSAREGGSPGVDEIAPGGFAPVLVNEALTHTLVPPPYDSIELFNSGTQAADVSGWFLSDDFDVPKKYRFPTNTVIGAGGYLVIDEQQFNHPATALIPFALSSKGDEVYVFSGDANLELTGYFHGFSYGAAETNTSFGRYVTSLGQEHFVAQGQNSLGTSNAGPLVGPVVISELMYHPVDRPGGTDNQDDEFIELFNITTNEVKLYSELFPTNRWRLSGAVDFDFSSNTVLGAGERLLAVSFAPSNVVMLQSFRQKYGLSTNIPVVGPYAGKLDNSAEKVELLKPETSIPSEVGYVLVDRVEYRDESPWPALADGFGGSLQRRRAGEYGNDVTNWTTAWPTAGAPYVGGMPPLITAQPLDQAVLGTLTATFAVTATGDGPLRYQWLFNGGVVAGGTNALLQIPDIDVDDAGTYAVLVFNAAGVVQSSNATLQVLTPALFTSQPTNVLIVVRPDERAAPTTNATFRATAITKNPPLTYQWLRNGQPVAGATSVSLTISNVQVGDDSWVQCAATDVGGTVFSDSAWLQPLVGPKVLENQFRLTVLTNSPVTLSAQLLMGYPPPFTNEWRRGSTPLFTEITSNLQAFYTVQAPGSVVAPPGQLYRLVIKNLANAAPGVPVTYYLVTVIDSDQDGLPDYWETEHGFATNNVADGAADADGDTMSNWEEYVAGTDPTNALSYLKVDTLSVSNAARLDFMIAPYRTYTIEYSDNLAAGLWTRLTDVVARTNSQPGRVIDPGWATNRFYRLVTPRHP